MFSLSQVASSPQPTPRGREAEQRPREFPAIMLCLMRFEFVPARAGAIRRLGNGKTEPGTVLDRPPRFLFIRANHRQLASSPSPLSSVGAHGGGFLAGGDAHPTLCLAGGHDNIKGRSISRGWLPMGTPMDLCDILAFRYHPFIYHSTRNTGHLAFRPS